ncbi:GNAT family N-acetyltransferase [uncultured Algimonas sp.]|uniref:GNAT family N-acetyltransferase n=1 Tax=uncultured Algimonas sp. TaxID=1547920 RepID=UPI0026398D07|nr:GNAT family N-acetyltransferase [uncultured Algimonas sp.]
MDAALTYETVAFGDLSDEDRAQWLSLRAGDPALESPYHHPDYHAMVDDHQGGVKVTLARQDGEIVALLPWQGRVFARPSGAPLSDYQAVIAKQCADIDAASLLSGQKIGAFHYAAMPRKDGRDTARLEIASSKDWRDARDGSYRRHLKSTRRRIRKTEDEIGAPCTVFQSRNIDAYRTLIRWKRDKFDETGKFDVLGNPGTSGLLRALWERGPEAGLRADLHVLYFGDRIAACDLGLTDGRVFHSWIIGYDPDLQAYAPGIQLLERLIDAAPDIGYRVIDLGPETDGYKRHYATHPRRVGAGVIALPRPSGRLATGYDRMEDALREHTHDALGKLRRRYSQIAACEPHPAARSRALAIAIARHFGGRSA